MSFRLRQMLDRLKDIEHVRHDSELAKPLGVSKAILAQWKPRGTIPWERLAAYAETSGVSLDWLVFGRGLRRAADIAAKAAPTTPTPQVREFILAVTLTPVERSGT